MENAGLIPMIFISRGSISIKTTRKLEKSAIKIALRRAQDAETIEKSIATYLSFIIFRMELAYVRGDRNIRTRNNASE